MPTGTLGGGSGSRTYPPDEAVTGYSTADTNRSRRPAESPPTQDTASLRRENEALRRANHHLKDRLDSMNENQQDVIDHYERLLAELYRRQASGASARTARSQPSHRRSKKRRPSSPSSTTRRTLGRLRSTVARAVVRVSSAFGLR
ncbi:hypothetical protein GJR98_03725 [Haloferax sp. MBLA0077]|uniref:BZIP transcription factor n=2 Tax=Haloferax TaxID=2251 RepID=A0A6G1Z0B5_9EURY|nr:hypothetical protein Hfx1149_03745 [Haloferax sp. CBA1149]MRW79831.1 hypothetical protein [Haloferax marinisediminis]